MNFNYYNDEALETIARKVISQYDPSLLYKPSIIPVEDIMEKVYGLTLEFQYIRNNGRILGETIFENAKVPIYERENNKGYKLISVKAGTVIIDASLLHEKSSSGRLRFTCAHELAHWVIDKNYFMQLGETANLSSSAMGVEFADEFLDYDALQRLTECSKSNSKKTNTTRAIRSSDTDAAIERQANRMASRILMPKCTLKPAFYSACNNVANVVAHLAMIYGVSKQAMQIRLEELGLLG